MSSLLFVTLKSSAAYHLPFGEHFGIPFNEFAPRMVLCWVHLQRVANYRVLKVDVVPIFLKHR